MSSLSTRRKKMNIEKSKYEFIKYINNYDKLNPNIARKIGHSIRVMEISKKIAQDLKLNKEQIQLASLIGLLHDIARFEQWKRYETFKDSISVDHGDLGVEILKENNFIRNFIEETKYDNILLKAIQNHNKYKIQEGLTEEENLFSKIVRDADKLDIMYEGTDIFWDNKDEVSQIENSKITTEIYNQFISKIQVKRIKNSLPADRLVIFIGFIFDINFKYDFKILSQKDYINKILDKFNFKDEDTKIQMKNIRDIANKYIKQKIEDDIN